MPGVSAILNAPVESVCVVRPPGDAVIVVPVTGRGGHGCPACSTGHVGPAVTFPSAPLSAVYVAVGPGVVGGCVNAGAFVVPGVGVGPVDGDAAEVDGVGDAEPDARCDAVVCEHDAKTRSATTAVAR